VPSRPRSALGRHPCRRSRVNWRLLSDDFAGLLRFQMAEVMVSRQAVPADPSRYRYTTTITARSMLSVRIVATHMLGRSGLRRRCHVLEGVAPLQRSRSTCIDKDVVRTAERCLSFASGRRDGRSFWECRLMDLRLRNKVVLITGSSRGIGFATAKGFADEGCRLMLSARSADALRAAADVLQAGGATVASEPADVTQPDDANRLVRAAVGTYGGIDILINNVGGGGGGRRIADSTDDEWRDVLERNLVQAVRMMRLALPHMRGRAGAAVVNVASISGWTPQLVGSGQYGAAKAALIFEAERWALEFVPHSVRVNTVSPGSILVEGNGWDRYRVANAANFADYVRGGFPMGRLGTTEEVADVIVFLASPRAHWINGRHVPVDGLEQPYMPVDWRPY
jgi:3-oxoacyl-[acyl-carrier protein] reductase